MNFNLLIPWCDGKIKCDQCGVAESATWRPELKMFVCESDMRLRAIIHKAEEIDAAPPDQTS